MLSGSLQLHTLLARSMAPSTYILSCSLPLLEHTMLINPRKQNEEQHEEILNGGQRCAMTWERSEFASLFRV